MLQRTARCGFRVAAGPLLRGNLVAARSLATAAQAQSRPFLSPEAVTEVIASQPIVVFTKSFCPFCKDLVERLVDAHLPFKEVALNKFENGQEVKERLKEQSGQEHVPYIYIKGQLYGGDNFVEAMRAPGTQAQKIFAAAGITAPGPGGYWAR